jgi:hypothetical protein
MEISIKDLSTGRTRIVTYRGSRAALEELRHDIIADRGAHKPPGTPLEIVGD